MRKNYLEILWIVCQFGFGILVAVGILLGIYGFFSQSDQVGFWINVIAAIFLGGLGYFFVSPIREARERNAHFKRLLREMGSRSNEVAIRAVEELRVLGYLTDGSIPKGTNFSWANLRNAPLEKAKLKGVNLSFAHLEGADLRSTEFESADLSNARLEKAALLHTNFEKADLNSAHFEGTVLFSVFFKKAHLYNAFFRNAVFIFTNFSGADLYGADLRGAEFSKDKLIRGMIFKGENVFEGTELPDGSFWNKDTDMAKFTNQQK